jgi:HNH endonuclease
MAFSFEEKMSKEEIIAAIRECAEKLGRCPKVPELKRMKGIGLRTVRRHFGSYGEAVRQAGFDPQGQGYTATMEALFADWAGVCRQLGKLPTIKEYGVHGKYSVGPMMTRFGGWTDVPRGMRDWVQHKGLEADWKDVLEMIKLDELRQRRPAEKSNSGDAKLNSGRARAGRPLYGSPLTDLALLFAPTNEAGVLYLFGMVARQLGLVMLHAQAGYPDCQAARLVEGGKWQLVNVELEFQSRNFLLHQHDPRLCDVIVCWEHNWAECPEEIEVIELRTVLERMK